MSIPLSCSVSQITTWLPVASHHVASRHVASICFRSWPATQRSNVVDDQSTGQLTHCETGTDRSADGTSRSAGALPARSCPARLGQIRPGAGDPLPGSAIADCSHFPVSDGPRSDDGPKASGRILDEMIKSIFLTLLTVSSVGCVDDGTTRHFNMFNRFLSMYSHVYVALICCGPDRPARVLQL